jgi:hypothetical protein
VSKQNIDPYNAFEAKTAAQELSFAPIVFQAARTLRDLGILASALWLRTEIAAFKTPSSGSVITQPRFVAASVIANLTCAAVKSYVTGSLSKFSTGWTLPQPTTTNATATAIANFNAFILIPYILVYKTI